MAAVLAVALLLFCGNVLSAEEGAAAYVTQVKTSLTTAPAVAPAMAPAITTTTEGSDTTHSAVLSAVQQGQDANLVVVDLARADDEKLINVASVPEPSPSASSIPDGFDMVEAEAPAQSSTEVEALEPTAAGPDSTAMDKGASFAADSSGEGHLATGEFPTIEDTDHSGGAGYGVRGGGAGGQSFPAMDKGASFAADSSGEGHLATGEFPTIEDTDHSGGAGYGVRGGGAGGQSFPAMDKGASFAADSSGEGHLATGEFPTIEDTDHSGGAGYGVRGGGAGGQSFPAMDKGASFAADSSGEGHLATGEFPTIEDTDHSGGAGYGVRGGGAGGQSFPAMDKGASFAADSSGEGHLATGEFPTIEDTDHSGGAGYGVRGGGAGGQSFPAMDKGASFAADSSGEGHLATGEFPTIEDTDHSGGAGYGVRGGGAGGQSFPAMDKGASFAADSSGEGHLATGEFPTIEDTDHSGGAGYGVRGGGAGGQSFPAMDKDSASAMFEDEARPGSNAFETTGVTFGKSHTYLPASTSKATWGKGKCTFYGGMDAAGTMSGACGYGNLYASGYGAYSAALSSALFKNGVACGACYEVACSGSKSCKPGSVLVTVTNFCPPNPGRSADNGGWCNGANQHFDLSYPAFARIADPKAGVVALDYRRVPCKKQGGIRFTLNGNCNLNLVTITNVGGSGVVIEVYMKGDKMDWAPMTRNWGANWQCSRNYCGKGISIKIVTSDRKVSVSRLAGPEWAFGKTYIGQQVY